MTAGALHKSLAQFEFRPAGNIFFGFIDKRHTSVHERRKPFAVVDEFADFYRNVLLVMIGVAVKAEMFEHSVSKIKDCAAGSFVDAAAFHADAAVFADIDESNAIPPADCV